MEQSPWHFTYFTYLSRGLFFSQALILFLKKFILKEREKRQMEYIAKKINMVDILGMLIPGGLMLLILEQDIQCLAFLTEILGGVGASNLFWCIIFLCGSYLVGMLLHEIGSVIEKLLWKCPLTNPRVYAALTTKIFEEYPKENHVSNEFVILDRKEHIFSCCFYALLICFVIILVCLAIGCHSWLSFIVGSLSIILAIVVATVVFHFKYCKNLWSVVICKQGDDTKYKELRWTMANDLDISKKSFADEEILRKRALFDGYRALMRSVLVMLAVLQLYVTLIGEGSPLATCVSKIASTPAYSFLRILIVTALVIRYWHYSCVKFTYIYNGYLYNPKKTSTPNSSAEQNTPATN